MTHPQRDFALEVLNKLRAAGHEALFAGGCVRDQLLGREPQDFDVATSARPEQVRELFGKRRSIAVGAAFGVIAVLGGRGVKPVEVATFRTDGDYRDGRRPESVTFADAEHDAQRRDFTVNGLFFDPLSGQVVDYVGGGADLDARLIRAIGEPQRRFAEDKLRLLRAVRFATTLGFEIEPATLTAVREMASEASTVSGERIGAELRRIFAHAARRRGVELLAEAGLLRPLLPELAGHCAEDDAIWNKALDRLGRLAADADAEVAVAALVADASEAVGVRAVARRWRLSNKEADRIRWLVGALPSIRQAAALPWPALQRILAHELSSDLLQLAEADLPPDDPGLARCREKLALPRDQWNPDPLVTGDDLVAAGHAPGRPMAELLEFLRDEQLEGRLRTKVDALVEADRRR